MSPVAMLMTGYILASAPVKPLLTDLRLYLAALIRAVLIPGIVFVILLLFRADRDYFDIRCNTFHAYGSQQRCLSVGLRW